MNTEHLDDNVIAIGHSLWGYSYWSQSVGL